MPSFSYDLTTPFSVSKAEMLALLHDPRRFMTAGGRTEPDSIRLDESTDKWHGKSKPTGIPFLSQPEFSGTYEETPDGSHWVVDAGMGITMDHVWTVEGGESGEVCFVTERVTTTAPFYLLQPLKWSAPDTQKKCHKAMQEYLS